MKFYYENLEIKCSVNTYNGYPSCSFLGDDDVAKTLCFYFSYQSSCQNNATEMIEELSTIFDLVEGFKNEMHKFECHDIGTDVDPVLISDSGIDFIDYRVGEVIDSCTYDQFLNFGLNWIEFIKTESKNIDCYRSKWWDNFHKHQASQNLDMKESIQKAHRKDTFFKRLSNLFG